jgi:hypothetical protein
VAAVADDAVRWAAAMRAASARMLADIDARQAERDQFRGWWESWTYTEQGERKTVPLDPDWESSVDQFLAAGLPLPVLKTCIDGAMRRKKIVNDGKFRYMCGIAWGKVGDLRKMASGIVPGNAAAGEPETASDPYERGRLDFARELLKELSEGERAYFLDSADMSAWQDEDDDPQTEAQLACEAVSYALNSARSNADWLVTRVKETLRELPGNLGERCLAEADAISKFGDPISRAATEVSTALCALEDLIDLPADVAYMEGLPEEERAEWITFARALYRDVKMSDGRWTARAAGCARAVKAGNFYKAMCSASGEHIPDCPARGTHYAWIAGLKCCEQSEAADHKGHLVCDKHLERLIDGTHIGRAGTPLTAVDFTEAKEAVPF